MERFSCIIFDLDGTIGRTNELIFASFNHVAGKYVGKQFTPTEITAMFGPPEEIAIENLVGKSNARDAMEDFHRYYEEHHSTMAGTYDGIRELLEFLKEHGVVLAVFTGKGKRSALVTLEQLGFKGFFDFVVTGSDVVNHKPSAEGIRKVMNAAGVMPEEVLMVGDSISDVKASREAGVAVAAVVWDSYGKDRVMEMGVNYLFHTVPEFSAWVKSVVGRDGNSAVV